MYVRGAIYLSTYNVHVHRAIHLTTHTIYIYRDILFSIYYMHSTHSIYVYLTIHLSTHKICIYWAIHLNIYILSVVALDEINISGCLHFSMQIISPRASNTFNQVAEAKRFEGVFLCRKVC